MMITVKDGAKLLQNSLTLGHMPQLNRNFVGELLVPNLLRARGDIAGKVADALQISGYDPRSHPSSGFSDEISRTRQSDANLGELSGRRIDLNRPAILLDQNVVANGKAKACALPGRLGGEERIDNLYLHVGRNASAVIADRDFNTITKVFGRGRKGGLATAVRFISALGCRIKPVCNQI